MTDRKISLFDFIGYFYIIILILYIDIKFMDVNKTNF